MNSREWTLVSAGAGVVAAVAVVALGVTGMVYAVRFADRADPAHRAMEDAVFASRLYNNKHP